MPIFSITSFLTKSEEVRTASAKFAESVYNLFLPSRSPAEKFSGNCTYCRSCRLSTAGIEKSNVENSCTGLCKIFAPQTEARSEKETRARFEPRWLFRLRMRKLAARTRLLVTHGIS